MQVDKDKNRYMTLLAVHEVFICLVLMRVLVSERGGGGNLSFKSERVRFDHCTSVFVCFHFMADRGLSSFYPPTIHDN